MSVLNHIIIPSGERHEALRGNADAALLATVAYRLERFTRRGVRMAERMQRTGDMGDGWEVQAYQRVWLGSGAHRKLGGWILNVAQRDRARWRRWSRFVVCPHIDSAQRCYAYLVNAYRADIAAGFIPVSPVEVQSFWQRTPAPWIGTYFPAGVSSADRERALELQRHVAWTVLEDSEGLWHSTD